MYNLNSKKITKNTIYNLLGYGIPFLVALFTIPSLINGLGVEKFGILNLAWIIIGYLSFFDFGISRAVTKIIAEKLGLNENEKIPAIFWTSILLMLFSSLAITVSLLFMSQIVTENLFKISISLQYQANYSFLILILTIPIVTTTAGLRGFLESHQKFDSINIIRIILGVSSFLFPLICLLFTNNLIWIVISLAGIRLFVWILYFIECGKIDPRIKDKVFFDPALIRPIFKLSGWMTLTNLIVPLLVYIDRFIVGIVISAKAIAFYSTPFEIVTKLLILPAAVSGVLFPAFSSSFVHYPETAKNLAAKSIKYIFIVLYPLVFVIMIFANEGLSIWINEEFAKNSFLVLQLFSIGVLFNSIGYIPFAFLDGIGRPDVTAKIQLFELPIYVIFMWFMTKNAGIVGAALIWMMRMILDTAFLFVFAKKYGGFNLKFSFNSEFISGFFLIISALVVFFINDFYLKLLHFILITILYFVLVVKIFLSESEKIFLISLIKTHINAKDTGEKD